jgi:hypothetical protein
VTLLGILFLVLGAGLAGWFGVGAPLGAAIFAIHPPFLNTLQAGVQRNLAPWLWNDVIQPVLTAPAWVVPLVLGLLFLLLGRRRRRADG